MIGSNRLGKTHWLCSDCALFSEGRHPAAKTPRNAVYWISVVNFDKIDEVINPKLQTMLTPGWWNYNSNKHTYFGIKGGAKGNQIVIKSQEAGIYSYESAAIHRLGVDEQHEERIFNSATRGLADHGGQVLIAATLIEGISWFYDVFMVPVYENKPESSLIELVTGTMYDNPTLDKDEIKELFRRYSLTDPDEADIRILGKVVPRDGKCAFNPLALEMLRTQVEPGVRGELINLGAA